MPQERSPHAPSRQKQKAGRKKIGVIGAGSWGTALAIAMARAGHDVLLWARDAQLARAMSRDAENHKYLPGFPLPENVSATSDKARSSDVDLVLIACPAQSLREIMAGFSGHLPENIPALICAKGIEQSTNLFMSDVLAETAPKLTPYVLSGPSFAVDVAAGLPTAVTLAGADIETTKSLAQTIGHANFRIYASNDILGCQIGGALKNVLAIACGISEGKGLGESSRAALITRAFSELTRLGKKLDARPETLTGLSGFGDLILTCSSTKSRNFSLGIALGKGQSLKDVLASGHGLSEGAYTASVVVELAAQHKVDMPISQAVFNILQGTSDADNELARLLARPMRAEIE